MLFSFQHLNKDTRTGWFPFNI